MKWESTEREMGDVRQNDQKKEIRNGIRNGKEGIIGDSANREKTSLGQKMKVWKHEK